MNYLSRLYLRVSQRVLTTQGAYVVIFMGILAVALFIISAVTRDHTVEIWSSLLSGFAFGMFLICLPALINYFKR
ncbi:MAG TPA: hypothetical protein VNW95_12235 [Mucilaginibacter sp.]|jgi:hypothetical protein|nr:hypothetical protein [Mucilaginibacter sp.]